MADITLFGSDTPEITANQIFAVFPLITQGFSGDSKFQIGELYKTDHFKAGVRSADLLGLTLAYSPITNTDTMASAVGKAQGQINGIFSSLGAIGPRDDEYGYIGQDGSSNAFIAGNWAIGTNQSTLNLQEYRLRVSSDASTMINFHTTVPSSAFVCNEYTTETYIASSSNRATAKFQFALKTASATSAASDAIGFRRAGIDAWDLAVFRDGQVLISAPTTALADAAMPNNSVSFQNNASVLTAKFKNNTGTVTSIAINGGGGGSGLTSFNSRTAAAVIPTAGDYTKAQITGLADTDNVIFGRMTANGAGSRKYVLYQAADNDNQFVGIGLNTDIFRFQVNASQTDFVFYRGDSALASTEVMRVKGNGNFVLGSNTDTVNGRAYKFRISNDNALSLLNIHANVSTASYSIFEFSNNIYAGSTGTVTRNNGQFQFGLQTVSSTSNAGDRLFFGRANIANPDMSIYRDGQVEIANTLTQGLGTTSTALVVNNTVQFINSGGVLTARWRNGSGVSADVSVGAGGGSITNLNDAQLNFHTGSTRSFVQYYGTGATRTAFDLYAGPGAVISGETEVILGTVNGSNVEKALVQTNASGTNIYSTNFYANGNVYLQNGNVQYGMQKIQPSTAWGGFTVGTGGGTALFGYDTVVLGAFNGSAWQWALRATNNGSVVVNQQLNAGFKVESPTISALDQVTIQSVSGPRIVYTKTSDGETYEERLISRLIGADVYTIKQGIFQGSEGGLVMYEFQKFGDVTGLDILARTFFSSAAGIALTASGIAEKTVGTLWTETSDGAAKNISGSANIDDVVARYKKLPFIEYTFKDGACKKLKIKDNCKKVGLDVNVVSKIPGYERCLVKKSGDEYNKMDKSPILDDTFAITQHLINRIEKLEASNRKPH